MAVRTCRTCTKPLAECDCIRQRAREVTSDAPRATAGARRGLPLTWQEKRRYALDAKSLWHEWTEHTATGVLDAAERLGWDLESVRRRHVAMYVMRRVTGLSYPDLGQIFDVHHTSVIHAYEKVRGILAEQGVVLFDTQQTGMSCPHCHAPLDTV